MEQKLSTGLGEGQIAQLVQDQEVEARDQICRSSLPFCMQSHYLSEDRFGRPGKGNDKGSVEGTIGYGRRNFLVPMPRFDSFDDLNARLEEQCLDVVARTQVVLVIGCSTSDLDT